MEKVVMIIKKPEDTIKVQTQLLLLLPELQNGKVFECTICDFKQKRSLSANAYFHLLVDKLSKYHKIGSDEMKKKMVLEYGAIAYDSLGKKVGIKIPKSVNVDDFYPYAKWFGEEEKLNHYIFYKQTHTLDSKEMAKLIDGVVNECKEVGIETLDDLELKRLVKNWEDKNGYTS